MFHRKPIPSMGELRIVWKLSNLGAYIGLCVRHRLLNKIRIKTKGAAQVMSNSTLPARDQQEHCLEKWCMW